MQFNTAKLDKVNLTVCDAYSAPTNSQETYSDDISGSTITIYDATGLESPDPSIPPLAASIKAPGVYMFIDLQSYPLLHRARNDILSETAKHIWATNANNVYRGLSEIPGLLLDLRSVVAYYVESCYPRPTIPWIGIKNSDVICA
jgi:hypothetical protein